MVLPWFARYSVPHEHSSGRCVGVARPKAMEWFVFFSVNEFLLTKNLRCRGAAYLTPSPKIVRMQLTLHATRRTSHGASRLVQTMSAWLVKTRRAPSRHSRDARVYGHTTTAVHKLSTPPSPPPPKKKVVLTEVKVQLDDENMWPRCKFAQNWRYSDGFGLSWVKELFWVKLG